MNQVFISNLIMLSLLILAILGRNNSLAIAVTILLLLNLLGQVGGEFQLFTNSVLEKAEKYGLEIGIIILMIGVLSPLALGKIEYNDILEISKSKEGIIGIISGALVAILAAKGGQFLESDPKIVFSLIFGTILGVVAFKGYPVGPLVGSGIAILILRVTNLFR